MSEDERRVMSEVAWRHSAHDLRLQPDLSLVCTFDGAVLVGDVTTLRSTSRDSEVPDLSCPKCGVNSHDNAGEGWTHACDQGFVAALAALPERFTVIPSRDSEVREAAKALWQHLEHGIGWIENGPSGMSAADAEKLQDLADALGAILDRSSEAAPTPGHDTDIDGNHWNGCPGCAASEAAPVVELDPETLDRVFAEMAQRGWVQLPDGHSAATVRNEFLEAYARLTQTRTLGEPE